MSVAITGRYLGSKKVELTHEPSGAKLITSAPKDNQGDGSSFSPTDLVATALGSCMLTVMAIVADKQGWKLDGTYFRIEKHMSQNPRRVGKLPISMHLPSALTLDQRTVLERAALTCPVYKSINSEIEVTAQFLYEL